MSNRIVHSTFRLLSSGIALPGTSISNAAIIEKIEKMGVKEVRNLRFLSHLLGIKTRYFSRDFLNRIETPRIEDTNPKLASRAIKKALQAANLSVKDLGYLISHTTSPHTLLPPNISWVSDELNYGGVYAELRQACTGFANALQLASGMLLNPNNPPVGIVGSETGSVFFDPYSLKENKEQLINLAQMGDGAAAVILAPDNEEDGARISHLFFGAAGLGKKPGLSREFGGSSMPFDQRGLAQFSHDFAYVKENGIKLFKEGLKTITSAGIDLNDIQWIIPHQANGRMDEVLAPLINIPTIKFFTSANKVGNTGSASIWIALHQLRESKKLKNGDKVLILGAEATKFLYGGFIYHHYENKIH